MVRRVQKWSRSWLPFKFTMGDVILSLILNSKIHSSAALAPILLGDIVINDDDDEGEVSFWSYKWNGYPKFDVG